MPGNRSLRKGPYVQGALIKAIQKSIAAGSNAVINTRDRASTILPMMIGAKIGVHNGRDYVPILITETMIGHKLGEFVLTRLFRMHSGDRKAKGAK